MIDTSDFRNGLHILQENDIYTIVEFQHVKPGKGGAFVRSKLKNLRTGATIDKTWRAGEKMEQARIERKPMLYLYEQGGEYFLMDPETYDQVSVAGDMFGGGLKYLKDNMEVTITDYDGKIIGVEVPFFVELEVTMTDPSEKGDTASGGSKPATLETGAVVQVPFFVKVGDKLKVDTRTDSYLERVKS